LASSGYAVWNIEYRRLGEAGAGYPGTFEDVADAVDWIRGEAQRFDLDTRRVIALGHSAGGHLALWAAARPRIPASSPLHRPDPLRVRAVISVGGIGDLEGQAGPFESACGEGTFASLLGPHPSYADTSPARLLPTGVPIVLVHGEHDHVMPPGAGRIYVDEVRAAGDRVEFLEIPGAGHFDAMIPTTTAWRIVAGRVQLELRRLR
jgi:acetyl esterase/lipase